MLSMQERIEAHTRLVTGEETARVVALFLTVRPEFGQSGRDIQHEGVVLVERPPGGDFTAWTVRSRCPNVDGPVDQTLELTFSDGSYDLDEHAAIREYRIRVQSWVLGSKRRFPLFRETTPK